MAGHPVAGMAAVNVISQGAGRGSIYFILVNDILVVEKMGMECGMGPDLGEPKVWGGEPGIKVIFLCNRIALRQPGTFQAVVRTIEIVKVGGILIPPVMVSIKEAELGQKNGIASSNNF